ncbi:MAG: pyridoxamine 5'-phosphate oxidase family protein [Candidatus Methanofastidiosia archaeon]
MTPMNEKIKELIKREHLAFVATASKEGMPNVSPKGSITVLDDNTLVFAEIASPHTIQNLKENPKIALYVLDKKSNAGCQIKGNATLTNSGPVFEKIATNLKKMAPHLPPANYAIVINVEDVFPYRL